MRCEYHDFIVEHSSETEQVEHCRICGLRKVYKKISGRVNNREYLKDHTRDFAQPHGPTDQIFQRFYGKDRDRPLILD